MSGKQSNEDERQRQWLAFIQELSPDTEPQTIRLVGRMHRVAHALYQCGESSVAEIGLSYSQYRLLINLLFAERFDDYGQLNPSEISERQGISRNTVSSLIRNLEEAGLIERHLDLEDRRKFNICLTVAGRELSRKHASGHFRTLHAYFSALTAEEQQTLSELLQKLGAALHAVEPAD